VDGVAAGGTRNASAETPASQEQTRSTPLARKLAHEYGVDLSLVTPTGAGGRVREQDVLGYVQSHRQGAASGEAGSEVVGARGVSREPMTTLRRRIATRLVEAQQTAAMLTTFNEADMSAVMELRKRYKESFAERHGVGLGFMSFFIKAVVHALEHVPALNAFIVADESGKPMIEKHDYCDIAVAVSSPKGLVVPVLRDCQDLSFAEIEQGIRDLAIRARDGKLTLDDLQGGTFTITNGGIFGSLMSTPILNPPQSGILGMHAIKKRAVEDPDEPGRAVIRPMMYLALSYDHRLVDGAEAVTFLVKVKEAIEDPSRLMLGL
jgi:2-oxoglutarate dehydrogenase E2 component (dihydrolipoamide succinyltransferase)